MADYYINSGEKKTYERSVQRFARGGRETRMQSYITLAATMS